jgi:hypothetical protein
MKVGKKDICLVDSKVGQWVVMTVDLMDDQMVDLRVVN